MSNNMYGDYTDVDEAEVSSMQMNTIHEGVVLTKIAYENNGDDEFLKFSYKKTLSKANVEVLTDNVLPIKRWPEDTDEDFKDAVANWNKRMKHIASKYDVTLDQLKAATANVSSLQTFSEAFIALVSPKLDGRQMYLKVFSNKKGWGTVPRFPKFLQLMSEGDCQLTFSTWEKNKMKEWAAESVSGGEVNEVEDIAIEKEDDTMDI